MNNTRTGTQAGVIPALHYMSDAAHGTHKHEGGVSLAFVGTFMPPLSLLALPGGAFTALALGERMNMCARTRSQACACVSDVGASTLRADSEGSWLADLLAMPKDGRACDYHHSEVAPSHAPVSVDAPTRCAALVAAPGRLRTAVADAALALGAHSHVASWWPHVDTDELPRSLAEARLEVHCVQAQRRQAPGAQHDRAYDAGGAGAMTTRI